jgi:c-di-GMP-binding flagellar brake protein YcgR
MDSIKHEKRRFRRVVFSTDEGVVAVIRHPGMDDQLMASNIVNISEGGLQFIIKKDKKKRIKEGDILTLTRIKGKVDLEFTEDTEMEIRWILDLNYFDHVGVGCKFVDISGLLKGQIKKFVEMEGKI